MRHIIWIGLIAALLLATACAGATSGQKITITGKVLDVSRSARIITLTESVQGFGTVALTDETEVFSTSGNKATLQDVQNGMTIQASGKPGTSGAMIASRVNILQTGST
ncbi:MAG: hypothetical protein A2Y60_00965 [Chloroflexi bacterium RBG_13_54_9]|nr:MAG: hypothetical protein A2Y60_00965 [Chloroflexi bacterium RBG_13_54_9]